MNTEQLAFSLLARLHEIAGSVQVTQCDCVPCEDGGKTTMVYLYYDPQSDACAPLCFDTPPGFDPAALTLALLGGGTVH